MSTISHPSVYRLGRFDIDGVYCGNASELLAELPERCIDLTVTSPPYDNLRLYNGYTFDYKSIIRELWRVTKVGGVVVWIVADETKNGSESGTSFQQALYGKFVGFNLHDTMIYLKNQLAFPDSNRYYNAFEYMFVLSKNKPKTFNPIMDRKNVSEGRDVHGNERRKDGTLRTVRSGQGNIIKSHGVRWNYWLAYNQKREMTTKHPAILPESLAHDHILSWSNENDIVLDPMCGSGTTLKMAKILNRRYVGFDISEEYCQIARERAGKVQVRGETIT